MSIKEEDLTIKYTGDIQPGQRFTKVGSKFVPIGGGSGDTSAFESEMTAIIGEDANIPPVLVSGMKFYKCASVDTTSKMWSGYELILTDGVYTVSETLTDGLSYSAVKPVIGGVYSQDALLRIRDYYNGVFEAPTNALLFYAPFSEASETAASGQPFTFTGTPTFETKCGVPVIKFDSSTMLDTYIDANTSGSNILSDTVTMSFWAYVYPNVCFMTNCSRDYNSLYYATRFYITSDYNLQVQNYQNTVTAEILPKGSLAHFAYVFEGNDMKIYINGLYVTTQTTDSSVNRLRSRMVIHCDTWYAPHDSILYMAALRVYKRALEPDEIAVLANEFTPTTAPEEDSDSGSGSDNTTALTGNKFHLLADELLINMNFNIDDPAATGLNRLWRATEEGSYTFIAYNPSIGWFIGSNYTGSITSFTNDPSLENPWDTTTWYYYGPGGEDLIPTSVEITVTA